MWPVDGLDRLMDGLVGPVHWIFFCFLIRFTETGRKPPINRDLRSEVIAKTASLMPFACLRKILYSSESPTSSMHDCSCSRCIGEGQTHADAVAARRSLVP